MKQDEQLFITRHIAIGIYQLATGDSNADA